MRHLLTPIESAGNVYCFRIRINYRILKIICKKPCNVWMNQQFFWSYSLWFMSMSAPLVAGNWICVRITVRNPSISILHQYSFSRFNAYQSKRKFMSRNRSQNTSIPCCRFKGGACTKTHIDKSNKKYVTDKWRFMAAMAAMAITKTVFSNKIQHLLNICWMRQSNKALFIYFNAVNYQHIVEWQLVLFGIHGCVWICLVLNGTLSVRFGTDAFNSIKSNPHWKPFQVVNGKIFDWMYNCTLLLIFLFVWLCIAHQTGQNRKINNKRNWMSQFDDCSRSPSFYPNSGYGHYKWQMNTISVPIDCFRNWMVCTVHSASELTYNPIYVHFTVKCNQHKVCVQRYYYLFHFLLTFGVDGFAVHYLVGIVYAFLESFIFIAVFFFEIFVSLL